jgi:hypothetical protein
MKGANMTKKTNPEAVETPVSAFSKEQLLKSKRYNERRDLLTVLLEDGRQYSHADVETLIDEFMKGEVN